VALGASAVIVGLTSLYGLAWNLKFLVGPVVDGISTFRRWVVGLEVGLAVVSLVLALPLFFGSGASVGAGFGVLAVIAATHDVAVDAFYIAALDERLQAAFSGGRVAAYRVAMLAASGGLVILAGATSFAFAFLVLAVALFGLAFFHAQSLPASPSGPAAGRAKPPLSAVLSSWLVEPKVGLVLVFLITYRAGDALLFAQNAKFLESLSLGTTMRGLLQGIVGTSFSIGGAILGGVWISRRGLARSLPSIAVLQASAIGLYVLIAMARGPLGLVACVVAMEQLIAGIGTAGLVVFILERSRGEHKATRFAVATAFMSFATTAAGSLSGFIVVAIGYPLFFALAFAAALPGVALSFFVAKTDDAAEPAALRSLG